MEGRMRRLVKPTMERKTPMRNDMNKAAKSAQPNTSTLEPVNIQWETTTARLAEARRDLAQAEHTCGQKIADGEDASVAIQEVQAAESQVRQLESAVAVL